MDALRSLAGIALVFGLAAPAIADEPATLCTWGNTPVDPTGFARLTPKLTNVSPSDEPVKLDATGDLAGGPGCEGEMRFEGWLLAGATCRLFWEWGEVHGVAGVKWFFGPGSAYGRGILYGGDGAVAGSYDPQVITEIPEVSPKCLTEEGITGANFSATVALLPRP